MKPLHVQVAEALGHRVHFDAGLGQYQGWICGDCPEPKDGRLHQSGDRNIDAYDTDWSVTGPLIEKYRIELMPCVEGRNCSVGEDHSETWEATKVIDATPYDTTEPTPLKAVCKLIVLLGEKGLL